MKKYGRNKKKGQNQMIKLQERVYMLIQIDDIKNVLLSHQKSQTVENSNKDRQR